MAEKGAYPPNSSASSDSSGGYPPVPPSYDASVSGAAGKKIIVNLTCLTALEQFDKRVEHRTTLAFTILSKA